MRNQTHSNYDIIGDIHGQQEKLVGLLQHLGYENVGGDGDLAVSHPEGRRVLFLGDFIDRGPAIREVLHLVRGMVDSGIALAVMGNHEFNAVAYHTPDGKGGHLRSHTVKGGKNTKQHQGTLDAFVGLEDEWEGWIAWFKSLPMWLDLGDFRAVHACWDEASMAVIGDRDLGDPDFLIAAGTKATPEFEAVEILLKGPEMRLPEGVSFEDKDGTVRTRARVRWWGHGEASLVTVADLAMPPGSIECDAVVGGDFISDIPNYPSTAPPVFVGHYWMPSETAKKPLAANVVCLDFSAAREGPMVAYRWDGREEGRMDLRKDRFVMAPIRSGRYGANRPPAFGHFLISARDCAMQMLCNATYIQKELPNVAIPDGLGEKIEAVCVSLIATKHDVMTEVLELDNLPLTTPPDVLDETINMIMKWLGEPIRDMDKLALACQAAASEDERFIGCSLLIGESATNILNASIAVLDARDALK